MANAESVPVKKPEGDQAASTEPRETAWIASSGGTMAPGSWNLNSSVPPEARSTRCANFGAASPTSVRLLGKALARLRRTFWADAAGANISADRQAKVTTTRSWHIVSSRDRWNRAPVAIRPAQLALQAHRSRLSSPDAGRCAVSSEIARTGVGTHPVCEPRRTAWWEARRLGYGPIVAIKPFVPAENDKIGDPTINRQIR